MARWRYRHAFCLYAAMSKINIPIAGNAERHDDRPARVLVVEDSTFERKRLVHLIKGFGHQALEAEDGRQALALLRKQAVDIVVSDWSMPNICGLTLCAELKRQIFYGQPYFIMLTGKTQPGDLVRGMEEGADDFIAKPAATDEIRVRIESGLRMLGLRRQLEMQNRQIQRALLNERENLRRIKQDVDAAARMQSTYLPDQLKLAALDYSYTYRAGDGVSGDALGLHALSDTHVGFYVLDVCGHGIASGMHAMSIARRMTPMMKQESLLFGENECILPPDRVVSRLNDIYSKTESPEYLVTLAYGVLDLSTGHGELCLAGHPKALVTDEDEECRLLGQANLPIGVKAGTAFRSTPFRLPLNGSLMLYSDGLVERNSEVASRAKNEAIVMSAFSQLHDLPARSIKQKMDKWLNKNAPDDDVSVLILKRVTDE